MIPTNKVTISFEKATEKNIRFALSGYTDPKPNSENLICDYYWYTDNPKTFDLSGRFKAKYWVVVFQNSDGSKISPSDMASVTVTVENLWYIDGNGDLRCQNMPYAPPSPLTSPYPSALWRVSEDVLTHETYPKAPEKTVSKPYPKALWRIDYLSPNMPYHALMPNIRGINMWSLRRENVIRVYDYRESQDGFKHNGLAILAPSECTSYHELNGRWDVELTHPIDEWGRWKTILPQNVLKINDQLFRIDEHTSVSGTSGIYIRVHAKHISYDLADEYIKSYSGENLNGMEFIRAMFGACLFNEDSSYDKYNFYYNSDIESRTGQVEISSKSLLNTLIGGDDCLINYLGGELYRDNFYFSINQRMEGAEDNAFALKYGFDMVGITQKIDYSEFATWMEADDNCGNWFAVSYVGGIYPIHHHIHTYRHFNYSNTDVSDSMGRLARDTQDIFGQLYVPKVSYEVNIASLKNEPKYSGFLDLQNYRLGDKGTIECDLLDIRTTQEIIAVEKDELTGDIKKIKLGNEVHSLIRPAYKADTVSKGNSSAVTAMQKQLDELSFREYIQFPIVTADGECLTTKDNEYLIYKG